jgi:hypothetical protein
MLKVFVCGTIVVHGWYATAGTWTGTCSGTQVVV